ncbi:hypothetical protein [Nocardia farcinica]|uniref:hypothetical protein n=1 Tax=Nocardia farcinica TaxID=37329 RepID=UPI000C010F67|nr:hypothetical protein [Nocardia farcinica]PFW98168.1 hypothetical protein CJ468_06495 [Nocardia farcinica]
MARSGFFRYGLGAAVAAFVLAVFAAIFPAVATAQDTRPAIAGKVSRRLGTLATL